MTIIHTKICSFYIIKKITCIKIRSGNHVLFYYFINRRFLLIGINAYKINFLISFLKFKSFLYNTHNPVFWICRQIDCEKWKKRHLTLHSIKIFLHPLIILRLKSHNVCWTKTNQFFALGNCKSIRYFYFIWKKNIKNRIEHTKNFWIN